MYTALGQISEENAIRHRIANQYSFFFFRFQLLSFYSYGKFYLVSIFSFLLAVLRSCTTASSNSRPNKI